MMSADRWIALCAMLTSVAAVGVSVSSDIVNRKQARLSVLPIPIISHLQSPDEFFITLKNVGVGPMLITSVTYRDALGTITDRPSLSASVTDDPLAVNALVLTPGWLNALGSGEYQRLVYYDTDPADYASRSFSRALRSSLDKTTVVVEYEDVYGTQFTPFEFQFFSADFY
ncbi:hypothetical protein SLH49_14050 [Cognatiyoonia sp. IB215446]|uniref:hypothetical protein n=1 Tax=Cognatiyoonia sp. IB215446 TaxID=3097355 RepID=UPI002A10D360|nr:hypothetical protein [Cognatiyoonia sp. IB215446]MDX8349105.1 hypothetical protein [Cognatiyoonia sp. IB215446]